MGAGGGDGGSGGGVDGALGGGGGGGFLAVVCPLRGLDLVEFFGEWGVSVLGKKGEKEKKGGGGAAEGGRYTYLRTRLLEVRGGN